MMKTIPWSKESAEASRKQSGEIVNDIRTRTGLEFSSINWVKTDDKGIAEQVLPILYEWFPRAHPYMRTALASCFKTPHAARYVDFLIDEWKHETDPVTKPVLWQAITMAAQPEHAEKLWQLWRALPEKSWHYEMLVKLATFPSEAQAVRDQVVADLEQHSESLIPADLEEIAKIKDPRIIEWFKTKLDHPNRYVRTIAKRAVSAGETRLPTGFRYAQGEPDRSREIYSGEIDLKELGMFLKQVFREFGHKAPPSLKARKLEGLPVNCWLVSDMRGGAQEAVWWVRLEDIDAVEIVLTTPGTRLVQ